VPRRGARLISQAGPVFVAQDAGKGKNEKGLQAASACEIKFPRACQKVKAVRAGEERAELSTFSATTCTCTSTAIQSCSR